ncbi:hypothetical protein ACB092_03G110400 [Castanea dentata]
MDTQEDITRYANILQMDSDFVAPFLSGSQNTSTPIQESFPAVEIVTSNPTKRGGNFNVDEDNLLVSLKDAKELYKASPTPTTGKKQAFAFEHCWVVLKNQPKWSMPKERSKGLSQTPSSIDQVGSNDDDTMWLERPIGRKAEKAKQKRTDDDKVDAQRADIEKERLHLETIREVQRVDIEKERLPLETIREEGRVMTMDTSGMNEKERLYFENLKDEILARQHID